MPSTEEHKKPLSAMNDFTLLNNKLFEMGLSFKAIGLAAYLWSRPKGWIFSHSKLFYVSNDEAASVWGGLKELEERGVFIRVKQTDGSMVYALTSFGGGVETPEHISHFEKKES